MSKLINRALIKMKKTLTHKKYEAVKFNFFLSIRIGTDLNRK